jgi:hypothetical protein
MPSRLATLFAGIFGRVRDSPLRGVHDDQGVDLTKPLTGR